LTRPEHSSQTGSPPAAAAAAAADGGDSTPPREERLRAGKVGRAHGLDGSFYVTGARPRLLALDTDVTIAGRTAAIVRRAGTDRRPIVRVHGVEDRAGAEALRGLELTVAVAEAPRLAEGEWWAHELEGCEVLDGERRVGTVTRMIELPSCEALEVERDPADAPTAPAGVSPGDASGGAAPPPPRGRDERESLLVPMVKDAIRRVDVARGVIDVNMDFVEE
jgi:16S rRNA processing protein RimM